MIIRIISIKMGNLSHQGVLIDESVRMLFITSFNMQSHMQVYCLLHFRVLGMNQ